MFETADEILSFAALKPVFKETRLAARLVALMIAPAPVGILYIPASPTVGVNVKTTWLLAPLILVLELPAVAVAIRPLLPPAVSNDVDPPFCNGLSKFNSFSCFFKSYGA